MEVGGHSHTAAELSVITRYLVGEIPDTIASRLYMQAINDDRFLIARHEAMLWSVAVKNVWLMACIDSALAIWRPRSTIRRRLLLVAAILECSPAYHRHFLPGNRRAAYRLVMLAVALRSLACLAGGSVLTVLMRK